MAFDPAAAKTGEFVCLDAGALIQFNRIGELDRVGEWFPNGYTPQYVMDEEIVKWKWKYTANEAIEQAPWLTTLAADTTEDAMLIAQLSRRFAESETKSIGELHVIALTARYRGTAIIEDNQARGAARSAGVKSAFFVSAIGAAVISDLVTIDEGWDLQRRLEDGRERSVIRSGEKKKFEAMVRFMQQWADVKGWRDWPRCLHNNGLDAFAIGAAKEHLGDANFRTRCGLG